MRNSHLVSILPMVETWAELSPQQQESNFLDPAW